MFTIVTALMTVAGILSPIHAGKPVHPTIEDYQWWREARFGIFIHWEPSSLLAFGGGGWSRKNNPQGKEAGRNIMTPGKIPEAIKDGSYMEYFGGRKGQVPMEIYDNLPQVFNPTGFDAEGWVKVFKDAGAKYIVFTTKHQGGFCMFDSKYTDYDIMSTPYAKDILKELTDACHKAGIKVIFYYSKPDWSNPAYDPKDPAKYERFMVNQLEELCTNYGEIKGFWWDGGDVVHLAGKPIYETIQKHFPGAIFNARGCLGPWGIPFGTPEQKLGAFNRDSPWESCVTMQGEGWFWNGGVNIIRQSSCVKLLVNAATGDGNLLLDFGPTSAGTIPEKVRQNYLGMGQWLKNYGESIYGTRGGPFKPGAWGGATCKGNTVYLHILQEWPKGELHLPKLPAKIVNATALTGGKVLVRQTDRELIVNLPQADHARPDTIIKLELDRDALAINPMPSENLEFVSLNATARASTEEANWRGWAGSVTLNDSEVDMPKASYYGEDATDRPKRAHSFEPSEEQLKKYPWIRLGRDHIWRYWMSKNTDQQPWLELDLGKAKTFNKITIVEKYDRAKKFMLQYLDASGKWITFHDGLQLGTFELALATPITARKVRLWIIWYASDNQQEGAGLKEFDLWMDKHN